jgi:hypothetical protein
VGPVLEAFGKPVDEVAGADVVEGVLDAVGVVVAVVVVLVEGAVVVVAVEVCSLGFWDQVRRTVWVELYRATTCCACRVATDSGVEL